MMSSNVDANMPISRITVASLADLGYVVNMPAADAYSAPLTPIILVPAAGKAGGGAPGLRDDSKSHRATPRKQDALLLNAALADQVFGGQSKTSTPVKRTPAGPPSLLALDELFARLN
jgi:hypothetical protein